MMGILRLRLNRPHENDDLATGVRRVRGVPFAAVEDVLVTLDLMALAMFVASEDATSGSVIANADRVLPASSGFGQRSFCASVPWRKIVSILPVSGAEQLNTSGANRLRPMISHSGA